MYSASKYTGLIFLLMQFEILRTPNSDYIHMQQNRIHLLAYSSISHFDTRKFGWIVGIIKQQLSDTQIPAALINWSVCLHLCLAICDCSHAYSSYPLHDSKEKEVIVSGPERLCCIIYIPHILICYNILKYWYILISLYGFFFNS